MPFYFTILSLHAAGSMTDYYVTPSGAVGVSCQASEPCSFQTALDYADNDGLNNTIHVAAGTYTLSGTSLAFSIMENKSLTIEGANAATTIIDGVLSTRLFKIYRTADDTGVQITIRNLTFKRGSIAEGGNGVYINNLQKSNVTLEDNRFLQNDNASGNGGGIYINNYSGTTIIRRNIFRDNTADAGGGVFAYTFDGRIEVIDNEFSNNAVTSEIEHNGGGLYTSTLQGTVVVANNIFSKNSALNNGGGYFCQITSIGIAHIVNNTFVENNADMYGGGIYLLMSSNDASHANIYNNIIWSNTSLTGDDLYINNNGSSVTGATCNISHNLYGPDDIDYYVYKAGSIVNTYNIHKNPLLTGSSPLSDGRRSLRLFTASPAINAGNSCATGVQATDYEGAPRVQDNYINLGAVEAIVPIMAPVYYLLMQ